eukprot:2790578-Rhodomonas_salina.6
MNSLNLYKTEAVQKRRYETKAATGRAVPTIHGYVCSEIESEKPLSQSEAYTPCAFLCFV